MSESPVSSTVSNTVGSTAGGPVVGVVMGSDSDWPVMREAAAALQEFGIAYEADVVSAHRMPDEMIAYGQRAAARGLRVIIAGAGERPTSRACSRRSRRCRSSGCRCR